MRVLVVDDHQDSRELLEELLRSQGIEAEGAGDAETALAMLRASPYAGALIDLRLPGTSGVELLRWIRSEPDLAPMFVVVISGLSPAAYDSEFIENNAEAVLMKPFEIERLLSVLRRAADRRKRSAQ